MQVPLAKLQTFAIMQANMATKEFITPDGTFDKAA